MYHKLCDENNWSLLPHRFGSCSLKSRCLQGWFLLRALRGRFVPGLSASEMSHLPESSHFTSPLCVCLCVQIPLYISTPARLDQGCVCVSLSHVRLSVSPWILACQAPLSILEWVAIPFSRGSSQPKDWTGVSWIHGGVGSHSLLQGIFLTQGLEPRSPASQEDSLPSEPQGKPPVRLH